MKTNRPTTQRPHRKRRAADDAAAPIEGRADTPAQALAALRSPQVSVEARGRAALRLQRAVGNAGVGKEVRRSADQVIQREMAEPEKDQFNAKIGIGYGVPLIPQPTDNSCWAGAMAMLVSYHRSASITPERIANAVGYDLNQSYGWDAIYSAANAFGLKPLPSASLRPRGWSDLLMRYGPLWIVEMGNPSHAVVLSGMHGDGTAEFTEVTIHNPWAPMEGEIQYRTFMDFATSFGGAADAVGDNVQILHG